MAQTKPLFVPWLYEQVQSGRYPGVCWKDEEKTKFSIPWKHALRQDSNSDDVLIFKAWAQTSTNGDGRINGDPSVWKRNFRSALRAKGFQMIFDNKNDAANPHKVYLFPAESHSAGSEGSQETDALQDLYLGEEEVFTISQPHLDQCFIDPNLPQRSAQVSQPHLDQCFIDPNLPQRSAQGFVGLAEQELFKEASFCAITQLTAGSASGIEHFPIQEPHRTLSSAVGQLEQTAVGEFSADEAMYESATCYPFGGQATNQVVTPGSLETYFKIKVYYKGKLMLDQLLENDAGFRLMYQESMDDVFDISLPVVKLPSPDDIHDHMQAMLTKEILENLGGLEFRRLDGEVLGHRWGKSRVYWGVCKHEQGQIAKELSKNTPEVIYFFKDYISGLMEFIQKGSGPSPSYTLYFCLGEKWPDPKMRPWEKKLIWIEVVLTSLEDLKTMAVAHGASSLQSTELQLSLEQMMELCSI